MQISTLCAINLAHASQDKVSLFISKGEQRAIPAQNLRRYSIGNPEILSRSLKHVGGKLLIKGRRVGYTDIIMWKHGQKKQVYHIYVLSKKESLKLAQASSVLEDLGLKLSFKGKVLIVEGEIKTLLQLEEIYKLKKIFKNQILLRVKLHHLLVTKKVSEIYQYFSSKNFSRYECHCKEFLRIYCSYRSFKQDKTLNKKFPYDFIKFRHQSSRYLTESLKLKLYFIQIERSDGSEFSFGLNQVASSVKQFISQGRLSLIQDNLIKINKTQFKFQTLAKPEVSTPINSEGEIAIGLEIPFTQTHLQSQLTSTLWKEAGFKLIYKIEPLNEKLKFNYNISFSSPMGKNIAKSTFKGADFFSMNSLSTLIHLQVKSSHQSQSKVPLISQIPIIGKIFNSTSHSLSTKYIAIFFEVFNE